MKILETLNELRVTHFIWVSDSVGPWEAALDAAESLRLVRVCREGEAWPIAAGLHVGNKLRVVMTQTTSLFDQAMPRQCQASFLQDEPHY
jgi:sulfopyruvate decarboxylase subunit alpha